MTLAAHLPPVGWADVATRRDLDALEERMDLRFQAVELRFDAIDDRFESITNLFRAELHQALNEQTRHLYVAFVSSAAAMAGLVLAAVRLAS